MGKRGTAGLTEHRPRARALGVPFDGRPGPLNAITDVRGVEVGHCTLISGKGPLKPGKGPVRTGVTAVLPRGQKKAAPVFAGCFSLNGNGEMTGTTWVEVRWHAQRRQRLPCEAGTCVRGARLGEDGINGIQAVALPHDRLREILRRHDRLVVPW